MNILAGGGKQFEKTYLRPICWEGQPSLCKLRQPQAELLSSYGEGNSSTVASYALTVVHVAESRQRRHENGGAPVRSS